MSTTVEDFDEELNLSEAESEEDLTDEGTEEASLEAEEHEDDIVTPSPFDVLLGKDKRSFNHIGNSCFRHVISTTFPAYNCAPNRARKSEIIREIVGTIIQAGGRFLRSANEKKSHDEPGVQWKPVAPKQAREKVGHAIRDALNTRARQKIPIPDGFYETNFNWTSLVEREVAERVAFSQDSGKNKLKGSGKVTAMDLPTSGTTKVSAPVTPLNKRKMLSDSSIIANASLSSNKKSRTLSNDLSAQSSPVEMYEKSWMHKRGVTKKPLLHLPQMIADVLSDTPYQGNLTRLVTPSNGLLHEDPNTVEINQSRPPTPFVKSPTHHSITSSSEEDDEKSAYDSCSDISQLLLETTGHNKRSMNDDHHEEQVESPSISRVASVDSLFDECHRSISPLPFHHHSDHVPHHDDVPMWEQLATELSLFP